MSQEPQNRNYPNPSNQPPAPDWRMIAWAIVALMLVFVFIDGDGERQVEVLSYTQFKEEVRVGAVNEVTIRGQEIRGRFDPSLSTTTAGAQDESGVTGTSDQGAPGSDSAMTRFKTTMPSFDGPNLMPLLEENAVVVKAESTRSEWWQRLLITLLPWVLIIGLIFYFSLQMQRRMASGGGMFNFGRSKARRFTQESPKVKMDDVAGSENAKRDLKEVADYLSDPERYQSVGAELPRGVLMVGPPGTGKTMMAKAVAAEAGVPFFSISGSEFIEMFVGVGASRVRDMFKQAKDEAVPRHYSSASENKRLGL